MGEFGKSGVVVRNIARADAKAVGKLAHYGVALSAGQGMTLKKAELGPEDVARAKPAPDMLLAAAERLELPRERILYVG